MERLDLGAGLHAFSLEDPTCPRRLDELADNAQPPALGTATVTVQDLASGGSSVGAGGPGASTVELIDAAIAELQQARRLLTE
ncbi:hypothetical protein [Kineococcus sp. SYSU DK018]|uniref:hypothetical protein n=1 Tax=Kineococcus sp. SYSU DK018 TaxID=3383139 RepID=UPI003D7E3847